MVRGRKIQQRVLLQSTCCNGVVAFVKAMELMVNYARIILLVALGREVRAIHLHVRVVKLSSGRYT